MSNIVHLRDTEVVTCIKLVLLKRRYGFNHEFHLIMTTCIQTVYFFQYEEENTNVIIEDKDTTKLNCELDKFCDVAKIILDLSSVNFIDLVGVKAIRRVSCLVVNRNSFIVRTCL